MKCKLRINLSPFLKVGQELANADEYIEVETREQLVEEIAKRISTIKSPVDAYFEVAFQPETAETFSVERFRERVRGEAKKKYEQNKAYILQKLNEL